MEKMRIVLDENSLHISASGSIDGNIFFDVGGYCFPEENWFDYPSTLLVWWMDVTNCFSLGHMVAADLLFMDGPYRIVLKPVSSRECMAYFYDRDSCIYTAMIDLSYFCRQLLAAATKLTDQFPDMQIQEYEALITLAEKIRVNLNSWKSE